MRVWWVMWACRATEQFIEDHKDKDREYEFKGTSITLPGYSPFMMVVKREEDKPSAISAAGFLFYTSIGLSWPYRRWMDTLSLRRRTTVHKVRPARQAGRRAGHD